MMKKNEKGMEYNSNGDLKFEGEFIYDKKINDKKYVKRKLEYKGEYL